MASNVIARQRGDDYQAYFFWLKAAGLNHQSTTIAKVAWELSGTFGFDDVVVYHQPATLDHGVAISEEYFQVKFHVDYAKGFTSEALIDPEFIGAKKESVLQRLFNLYKKDPDKFKTSRYYLVNTWGVDYSNAIKELLDNNGRIRINRLQEGGDRSQFGAIRKSWRDHLGISDDELYDVLLPLRIKHSYDDEQRLKENLNYSLQLGGLKIIPGDERSSKYVNLIQQLHKEGRNILTREDLQEICAREGLLSLEKKDQSEAAIVGIRSFQRGAENLHLEVHSILCLQHRFIGRFVLDEVSWNDDIRPAIASFSETVRNLKKPIAAHLDTHLSCALYFGYCLDPKYGGIDITIVQKTINGKLLWRPTGSESSTTNLWDFEEIALYEDHADIAISLSVTKDIKIDVDEHFSTHGAVGKIFHATIRPAPNNSSIKDADQILAAVQELLAYINIKKRGKQKTGRVHLFLAAPNAFAFFLGQFIKPFGEVILYEYDFEKARGGNYEQVITISNH
jgi:hypothetical protein